MESLEDFHLLSPKTGLSLESDVGEVRDDEDNGIFQFDEELPSTVAEVEEIGQFPEEVGSAGCFTRDITPTSTDYLSPLPESHSVSGGEELTIGKGSDEAPRLGGLRLVELFFCAGV
mmetsp:Transcript_113954/g.362368  ORF Transcript_113954/g.362368 Transcript_113954/m.362368 type:complete len:117 (-) Transcript_113954:114-464(-)